MTEPAPRRMILRKDGAHAPSSAETIERIGASGVTVVDQDECLLLIEGSEAAVEAAARAARGWRAAPVAHYPIPTTRARIKRPPS